MCEGRSKPQGLQEPITQAFGCRSLVLSFPNIASGETTARASKLLLKWPTIRVFLVGIDNVEPRLSPIKPTNGSISGSRYV